MSATEALRVVRARNASPMTLDGTRTFVLGRTRPVVIDPGPDDRRHLDAVAEALSGVAPLAILLTHGHADHAAGAARLASRLHAPVWMARGALHPAHPAEAVDRWVEDGEEIVTDVGVVRAVATPGHAPEHLVFGWAGGEAEGGAAFVGDLMMGEGDTTLVAPPEGDLARYLESLDRLEALGAATLHPAHGPPIRHPAAAIARYREHRRARIEQVRDARAARPDASARELVDRVYGAELPPALRPAAEGSIQAILDLLRRGG